MNDEQAFLMKLTQGGYIRSSGRCTVKQVEDAKRAGNFLSVVAPDVFSKHAYGFVFFPGDPTPDDSDPAPATVDP